jgi:putative tricarboxylic transport membrane protein
VRVAYKEKVTDTMAWSDIPTCKQAGIPMEYEMLRGIFMPAGVSPDVVTFYVELFKKVRGTPEWQKFMQDGAFTQTFMSGKEYLDWVTKAEATHRELMKEAGFLAAKK